MHDQMVRFMHAVGRRSWYTKPVISSLTFPWRKKSGCISCMSYSAMKRKIDLGSQTAGVHSTKIVEKQKPQELSLLAKKMIEQSEQNSGFTARENDKSAKNAECVNIDVNNPLSIDQLKKRLEALSSNVNDTLNETDEDIVHSEHSDLVFEVPKHADQDESVESIVFLHDLATATLVKPSPLIGTEDPNIPSSDVPCVGCGALLQCNHKTFPGFLPSEHYKLLSEKELKVSLCQRCHYIRHGDAFVEVSVKPEEFAEMISKIKPTRSVVVMVVDVMDIQGSIIPNLMDYIGHKHPLVIVGNKADLLAPDDPGYLNNVKKELEKTCSNAGLLNIHKYTLISAKTGFGIEKLINLLFSFYEKKVDVFIVGTANVGKSSLFNTLLASDYCKNTARDLIQRATISVWPGTTLNLLKFPIMRPTPRTVILRRKRLHQQLAQKRELKRIMKMRNKEEKLSWELKAEVGMTDVRTDEQRKTDDTCSAWGQKVYGYVVRQDGLMTSTMPEPTPFEPKQFRESYWTYDTPGIINPNQIMNLLTPEEAPYITPASMIVPRCLFMMPGDTIFVSGLARLDYVKGTDAVTLAVNCGPDIPIKITTIEAADQFYEENIGTPILGIPLGDKERLMKIPPLVGKDFTVQATDDKNAVADIQLSSLGWISVALRKDSEVILRAYTPGMKGLTLRTPALMPKFKHFKGKRIGKTQFFHTLPPGSALAKKDVDIDRIVTHEDV